MKTIVIDKSNLLGFGDNVIVVRVDVVPDNYNIKIKNIFTGNTNIFKISYDNDNAGYNIYHCIWMDKYIIIHLCRYDYWDKFHLCTKYRNEKLINIDQI